MCRVAYIGGERQPTAVRRQQDGRVSPRPKIVSFWVTAVLGNTRKCHSNVEREQRSQRDSDALFSHVSSVLLRFNLKVETRKTFLQVWMKRTLIGKNAVLHVHLNHV